MQLHILPTSKQIPTTEGHSQKSKIHNATPAGADYSTGSRYANKFASLEIFNGVAKYFSIAVAVLVAKNDNGLVPGSVYLPVLRVTTTSAAWHGNGMARLS